MSALMLHAGGRLCTYDELKGIPVPAPQGRWHPIGHDRVLDTVIGTLQGSGFMVKNQQLAIVRHGQRFFGTLDLATPLTKDGSVALAVGIRNSIDQSFPLGFCAGSRVIVCDNLAFRSELLVKRKHTRFGEVRFNNAIAQAVQSLNSFKEAEAQRIKHMMRTDLTEDQAYAFILKAFEQSIISSVVIGKVLDAWKNPKHDYGTGDEHNMWRLANAFTTALADRAVKAPNEYAGATIRLNALLSPP